MPHPATLPEDELLKRCTVTRTRGGGPGGQRKNKVETAAILTHDPTGLSAQAAERRSQRENQHVALRRLRRVLAVHHRAPVPAPKGLDEIASPLWRSRREGQRIVCNPRHADYPALLAEALDVIADSKWKPRKAALRLGVTMSQLLKLIRAHPPAWGELNEQRKARKLPPLK
jgi:hypothetical protein